MNKSSRATKDNPKIFKLELDEKTNIWTLGSTEFTLPSRYEVTDMLGTGAYG
jgi:hypothetical protein